MARKALKARTTAFEVEPFTQFKPETYVEKVAQAVRADHTEATVQKSAA